MAVALSVVLPAYNEAKRLPPHFALLRSYLNARYGDSYEVIVVNDGSHDETARVVATASEDWPQLIAIHQNENQGKGAAVKRGMLAASGELLLFSDADGASPINEVEKLIAAVEEGADIAIGSRLVAASGLTRRRTWIRRLAGRSFAALARWTLGIPQRDTQCGFKLFRREVGRELFSRSSESRYLFDLELLALAQRLGHRVAEVPINWIEIPDGQLSLTREAPRMALGLWRIRRRLNRTLRSSEKEVPQE